MVPHCVTFKSSVPHCVTFKSDVSGPPVCSPRRLYCASTNWTLLRRSELDFVVPRCVTYKSWSPTVSHSSRRSPTVSHSSRMSLVPQSAVLVASTVPRLIGLYYAGQSWILWSPTVSHTSRGPPLCHIQVVGPPTVSHSSRMSLVPQSAVLVASTVPRINDSTTQATSWNILAWSVPYCQVRVWILWSPAVSQIGCRRSPTVSHASPRSPLLCLDIQVGCPGHAACSQLS